MLRIHTFIYLWKWVGPSWNRVEVNDGWSAEPFVAVNSVKSKEELGNELFCRDAAGFVRCS